jgi:hypothetical protein
MIGAGLNEEDLDVRIFTQPVGQDQTTNPCTNNDIVVFLVHFDLGARFRRWERRHRQIRDEGHGRRARSPDAPRGRFGDSSPFNP